jgi:hypothetical protein
MKKLLVTPEGTFELELTAEEISQREQDAIQNEQHRQEYLVEKQAKIDAKASALAKLTALGLTEEEVKSIL